MSDTVDDVTVPPRPDLEALREELIAAALPLDRFIASDGYPGMRVRSDTEAADIVLAVLDRHHVMRALARDAVIEAERMQAMGAASAMMHLDVLRSITGESG